MNLAQKKAYFDRLRLIVSAATVMIIAIIALVVTYVLNSGEGLVVFVGLSIFFFMQGLRNIHPAPPRRAIPIFWGSFVLAEHGGVSLKPRRTFFPWMGILFDYVLYDAIQKNFEIETIQERTPDNGELALDAFVTYEVDEENPVAFNNTGGFAGVEKKLGERIDTRLREWLGSMAEGPITWYEAIRSNGLAMGVLIQRLFPGALKGLGIPEGLLVGFPKLADLPVAIFVKYFTGLPALFTEIPRGLKPDLVLIAQREIDAHTALEALKISHPEIWKTLRTTILSRCQFVEDVKCGSCRLKVENLGIVVSLASLGQIQATDKTAKAADEVAAAIQEAQVRTIKAENFQQRVQAFALIAGNDIKAATEAVLLLDERVQKIVEEKQFAIRADNLEVIGPIVQEILEFLRSKRTGNP